MLVSAGTLLRAEYNKKQKHDLQQYIESSKQAAGSYLGETPAVVVEHTGETLQYADNHERAKLWCTIIRMSE